MDDYRLSKLVFFSLGIVAANKDLDSPYIEATPIEDLIMTDGELSDNGVVASSKGKDRAGSTYETGVDVGNTIRAKWMPVGQPNRITSPDVRRGEAVMLYQYADTTNYFWVTYKDDVTLRKLETVIYAFSGTSSESDGVSANTHYFLEISTHKKLVAFHTSDANGEPFTYDIQINTGEGRIVITDNVGNVFSLDSAETRIEIANKDGIHQDMNRKNYTVTVPDNTVINTGKNTTINSGKNTKITSGGDLTIATTGTTEITSAKNIINGPTWINGPIYAKSRGGGAGAVMEVDGSLTVKQTLTGQTIISPNRIQSPGINGVAMGLG